MSDSLWPPGLQHTRLPCPSPTPGACSNSCPSSWRCHPTISSCPPLLLLPSLFPIIKVFSNQSVLRIRWSKSWSFSSTISPSNDYSGLISSRIDWFDLHFVPSWGRLMVIISDIIWFINIRSCPASLKLYHVLCRGHLEDFCPQRTFVLVLKLPISHFDAPPFSSLPLGTQSLHVLSPTPPIKTNFHSSLEKRPDSECEN